MRNLAIVACAGSGKTSLLIDRAMSDDRRTAFVTYTNNNAREIEGRFARLNGGVPKHVDVMTWYTFLMRHWARPYQRNLRRRSIEGLAFVNQKSAPYIGEAEFEQHYFDKGNRIYSDKIAKFAIRCEEKTQGAVSGRFASAYARVFIDEVQDLAGWDLDILGVLLRSGTEVTIVGDPRQHIYSTNPAAKNKGYIGPGLIKLLTLWQKQGLAEIQEMSGSFRCNGAVCDLANGLWPPELPKMYPLRSIETGHDGVFLVQPSAVAEYVRTFQPQFLRYSAAAQSYGLSALNYGAVKGLEFDRVLIAPTQAVIRYVKCGNPDAVATIRDKLHVAVTRARYSVAFIYSPKNAFLGERWEA